MSTNFQKTPLIQSLTTGNRQAADDSVWMEGKSYPCTVSKVIGPGIVEVNFQMSNSVYTFHNIEMPVAKPPYVKYPIKVGDKGVAISADAPLGQMSGLGGGTPDPTVPTGNLSALMFVWLGNVDETFVDPDAVTVYDNLVISTSELAFFGGSKVSRQTVTGALSSITDPNAKNVLSSLINALAAMNLIQDGTS